MDYSYRSGHFLLASPAYSFFFRFLGQLVVALHMYSFKYTYGSIFTMAAGLPCDTGLDHDKHYHYL